MIADEEYGDTNDFAAVSAQDPTLAHLLRAEFRRQSTSLQLMAGENFASSAVMEALGSVLMNKYAEGRPGRRLHGGCEIVDEIELLAEQRATEVFGAEHANVQPYSGTSSVYAAYFSVLKPGDAVLAMSPAQGGHYTHGYSETIASRWFDFIEYGVNGDTGILDYDQIRDLARDKRPRAILCGANAYPRTIDYALFRQIAEEVHAYLIVDACPTAGLIAGGVVPNPVPYSDIVCVVTHKTLRGPRGGILLGRSYLADRLDDAVYPFSQGGPHMHSIAAKATALAEAATPQFAAYAFQTVANAQHLAAALINEGILLATGGTDTHQVIIDVTSLGISGLEARARCARSEIVLDACHLPHAPQRSIDAGTGIRLGTAAVTTQGMLEPQMENIASFIARALRDAEGRDTESLTNAVRSLVSQF
ncbi:serine hydroxymethyltransferase [Streptomyces sp. 1222.5]|uniref:serine hydroxymethyltransferase n=1 Tax=Streptomyces sp. 1222.5 TaxID=1881026 RepID=UPI003EBBD753